MNWDEIAERAEKTTGPDRELDLIVWRLAGGTCPPGHEPLPWLYRYTASVDAVLALIAEKLPGWDGYCRRYSQRGHGAAWVSCHDDGYAAGSSQGGPALALLAAFARAMAAQETRQEIQGVAA